MLASSAAFVLFFALTLPIASASGGETVGETDGAPSVSPCAKKAVDVIQSRYRATRDLRANFHFFVLAERLLREQQEDSH